MRKVCIVTLLLASCIHFYSNAQKVKYKDVFPLIQAGNWDQAEPLLKTYLADPKNHDDASAQYNMGKAHERRILAAGILNDTSQLFNKIDSANLHLGISLTLINEKELKKNDQYYQEFNRRDLRTGEFGIKVSDVHLDIENKIKALKERKQNIRDFHLNATEVGAVYNVLNEKMLALKQEFGNQSTLLLAYGDKHQQLLDEIENQGNVVNKLLELTTQANFKIPSSKFTFAVEKIKLSELADYTPASLDVTAGGILNVVDFAGWASEVKSTVRLEVLPFRQELIAYDRDLEAKKQQLEKNGTLDGLPLTVDQALVDRIRQFEENSLAEKLLIFKVNELNYLAAAGPSAFPDSNQVTAMYLKHQELIDRLTQMKELLNVPAQDVDKAFARNPAFFESRYVNNVKLNEFLSEKSDFAQTKMQEWSVGLDFWANRRKWLITTKGDSIPLFIKDSLPNAYAYKTLHLIDSLNLQVSGYKQSEKDLYFFASQIAASYTPAWMVEEKLPVPDKDFVFSQANINHAPAADGYSTFYTYYPVKGKTHLFMTSIDSTGNPLWKVSTEITRPPAKVSFNKMVMETIVYLEQPVDDPASELAYIVIDRTGKVRK